MFLWKMRKVKDQFIVSPPSMSPETLAILCPGRAHTQRACAGMLVNCSRGRLPPILPQVVQHRRHTVTAGARRKIESGR